MFCILLPFTLGYLTTFTIIFDVKHFSAIGKFESDVLVLEYEGFYNFSHFCLQFFSFLNDFFFRLFYENITFRHLFIIIKCPAELNFDCKILIRSVPSTGVTG